MSEMLEDIVREMRESMGWPNPDGRPLTARVQDYIFKMYADRIEAAERNSTLLCHQVCSCEILAKMEAEIASLRALVKEMADTLDEYFDDDRISALVDMARAREVCK